MKKINIEHLSELANIELEGEEKEKLKKDLHLIIKHIEKIQEVNTEEAGRSDYVSLDHLEFREDKVKKPLSSEEILRNAPRERNGYFVCRSPVNEEY